MGYDTLEVHFPIKACYLKLPKPSPKYDKYTSKYPFEKDQLEGDN